MNWFKENPFLAGILAVAVLGTGVLGYLISQAASANALALETYSSSVARLHTLQNKVPFPNDANLKTYRERLDQYQTQINAVRSQLAAMEAPLRTDVTPQGFQDDLRSAVNDIRTRATANGVELPENFYFGFDQYQTQVPTEAAAPFLDRQLNFIRTLVGRLVDFKVQSIDRVDRPTLPVEGGAAAAAATPAPGPGRPRNNDAPADPVVARFPFDITFTAEQGKFRVAFNSLLGKDQFLVVRSLSVENTSPLPPARNTATATATPAGDTFGGAPAAPTQTLQVLLGRELVKATIRLEMLDFTEPPAPKP